MKKDEFESKLLELWGTTVIPLTMDNLEKHTGAPPRSMQKWLDGMMLEGVVELDSDADGELLYTVPGASRPASGARTVREYERLEELKREVRARSKPEPQGFFAADAAEETQDGAAKKTTALQKTRRYDAGTAMSIIESARAELTSGRSAGDKSIVVSSLLSLFFGPLGWLYAGAFREAIPASVVTLALVSILPAFFLMPIAALAMPLSGIAGLVYAWQHNRSGERGTLFLDDGDE